MYDPTGGHRFGTGWRWFGRGLAALLVFYVAIALAILNGWLQ